jgi:Mg2+ and Co2+ transporter CorA
VPAGVISKRWAAALKEIMDEITKLAEQHVRESESHLKHIDELMERARGARAKASPTNEFESLLAQTQQDRDRLVQHLDDIRRQPVAEWPRLVEHGKRLKGVLEAVGLQLERAMTAIFK